MTTQILIVDDSPVDRRMIEFFLKKEVADVAVTSTDNGKKAIDLIVSQKPDLIITDLQMPEMNGLEMVENIVAQGWDVPVILMTGYGNQQIVVQALKVGAASYVPKRSLDKNLATTVQNVLSLSDWKLNRGRSLNSQVGVEMHFSLGNDTSSICPLVAYLQDLLLTMRLSSKLHVTRIGMAIHESLTNAIYHGNLELDSELIENNNAIFHRLAEERRRDQRYMARRARLSAWLSEAEIRFVVSDEGIGCNGLQRQNQKDEIDLDCIGGRGLLLIHSFMDEVIQNAQGHEITMVKRS